MLLTSWLVAANGIGRRTGGDGEDDQQTHFVPFRRGLDVEGGELAIRLRLYAFPSIRSVE